MDVESLQQACDDAVSWPLPGGGATAERWARLAALAETDLVLARLVEAHADAVAICAELGARPVAAGERWGVWAAEAPGTSVVYGDGCIDGYKAWCSGATLLSHALVTVEGRRLCAVDLDGVSPNDDTWAWQGMRGADTRGVRFERAPAAVVADDDRYLSRPGFWTGGIGVAACWYGGAAALAEPLRHRGSRRPDPHLLAHLGAVDVALGAARDALRAAAAVVDGAPQDDHGRLARRVRSTVADACTEVARRVGRALGPAPYSADPAHAQRVADLEVYVRQDHAERDLEALGRDVADRDGDWSL